MALPVTHDPHAMTADSTSLNHGKNPTSLFLSLPREIRDGICAYLLKTGDLAFLRTSKQLSHEGMERLYREGVCRLRIGFPDGGGGDSFFPQKWATIQNYHFRIFYGHRTTLTTYPLTSHFERFANHNEAGLKNECLITIEYCSWDPRCKAYMMRGLEAVTAYLTTFKTVVVTLISGPWVTWCPKAYPASETTKTMLDTWNTLKGKLEPGLGPAKLVGDANGEDRRLVFHPRECSGSLARRQEN